MLYIEKNSNSRGANALRNACHALDSTPDTEASYDKLDSSVRREVLESLLQEQGHVCAYCMRRICLSGHPKAKVGNTAAIEHYIVQNPSEEYRERLPDELKSYDERAYSIDYKNLLAVCPGGSEGATAQCCDKSRTLKSNVNQPLRIDPTNETHIKRIEYYTDGRIYSNNPDHNVDLDQLLNLNEPAFSFAQNRLATLQSLQRKIQDTFSGEISLEQWTKYRNSLVAAEATEKPPYLGILLWWLDKKIRKASRR
ncbi:HNH endonuclease family protein [Corynebacterium epidermidicanis]|uniref:TIGR02646 family protein n=1 Tax=Corynebacterium epidermidicanis TaxID=1050174 RepID=A0A0G3GLH6_9CORY|nr:hypothetical protein [Corynebacterium epidermidicanis]AKK02019.1 hypothetical protein CEPID_00625 [Corynebacterium epidermidicanis]